MSDQLLLTLGLAAIFVGVVLLLVTIGVITSERQQVGRSLAAVQAIQTAPSSMRAELEKPFSDRVLMPAFGRFSAIGRALSPKGQGDRIRRRLDLAGNPPRWDVDRVYALKTLGLLVGVLIGIGVSAGLRPSALVSVGITVILGAIGLFAPDIVLLQTSQVRQERVRRELPDALDLLSISVEAGEAETQAWVVGRDDDSNCHFSGAVRCG